MPLNVWLNQIMSRLRINAKILILKKQPMEKHPNQSENSQGAFSLWDKVSAQWPYKETALMY